MSNRAMDAAILRARGIDPATMLPPSPLVLEIAGTTLLPGECGGRRRRGGAF